MLHPCTWLMHRLTADERGATAVEYALMAAFIAAVIVTVVTTLGTEVQAMFQKAADAL
jgi:pilus assembly protein Flp/PilA